MKKRKKELIFLVIIITLITAVIIFINLNKNPEINNPDKIIKCIGENSQLIISPTCSACAHQKKILEETLENYQEYITLLAYNENPELVQKYEIKYVPTWIINNEKYISVQSIEKLQEITGC